MAPQLRAPPPKTIDALEATCRAGDAATCAWIVDLEKHLEKLDQTNG